MIATINNNKKVSQILRDLWRRRIWTLAGNMANGGREHREIKQAADLIRQDYHGRFLVELIQNANDQALRSELSDSTVIIVRTEQFVAVTNGGKGITGTNLERLSSLADSDKTGKLVGNKGVGFKSIYQVTDSPEIYSAEATEVHTSDLFTKFGLGVSFDKYPFDDECFKHALEDDVASYFQANQGQHQELKNRGINNALKEIQEELNHVAGFRFPLPKTALDLAARVNELKIPAELKSDITTLAILPLRDEAATKVTIQAIRELVEGDGDGPSQAELALLFLSGVKKIVVIDQVEQNSWSFSRTTKPVTSEILRATITIEKASSGSVDNNAYWLTSKDAMQCASNTRKARREIVEEALKGFELEAWKADDPLLVTIALPVLKSSCTTSLGSNGRFCLGLPTKDCTGLPLHVDARFFATISRVGLDFSNTYNSLLLDVAVELFGELQSHLKSSASIEDRRSVTLSFEASKGEMAERVFQENGLADGNIVLTWNGRHFIKRNVCWLPSKEECALLELVKDSFEDKAQFLKTLPDPTILAWAFDTLKQLIPTSIEKDIHPWLKKDEEQIHSTIELAAIKHRQTGPIFWEPFVAALLDCYSSKDLEEQRWLPIGDDALSAPIKKVFLAPANTSKKEGEKNLVIPSEIAGLMRILDARACSLRDGTSLTELATKLEKRGLIYRPRKQELLEKSLFPALKDLPSTNDDLALSLLGYALQWLAEMPETSRSLVNCKLAIVPVDDPQLDKGFKWVDASEAYVGEGWGLDEKTEQLLGVCYSKKLVSRCQIDKYLDNSTSSTTELLDALKTIGVNSKPRVIPLKNTNSPLYSYDEKLFPSKTLTLEDKEIEIYYEGYIKYLSQSRTDYIRRFPHDVNKLLWIEGLEQEAIRSSILKLILTHSKHYLEHSNVTLRRSDSYGGYQAPVHAFWVYAIGHRNWDIIEAEQGAGGKSIHASARQIWILPSSERKRSYAKLLNMVPARYCDGGNHYHAESLLKKFGVNSIESASLSCLCSELHYLAERIIPGRLQHSREALSLATKLFGLIAEAIEQDTSFKFQGEQVLPLLDNGKLEPDTPLNGQHLIAIDDDSVRSKHVSGIDSAWIVPLSGSISKIGLDKLHSAIVGSYGKLRVIRTSICEINLQYESDASVNDLTFLSWLIQEFPHVDVASEIAALLSHGHRHPLNTETVSSRWTPFRELSLSFVRFKGDETSVFYDKSKNNLLINSTLSKYEIIRSTWQIVGSASRDLMENYGNALEKKRSQVFLKDRGIGAIQLHEIAEAEGIDQSSGIESVECAIIAARMHLYPDCSIDDAIEWLSSLNNSVDDLVKNLDLQGFSDSLTDALNMPRPKGEFHIINNLEIPWDLWQEVTIHKNGQPHEFQQSIKRFSMIQKHIVAAAMDISARSASIDLDDVLLAIKSFEKITAPDSVRLRPPETANNESVALNIALEYFEPFNLISKALKNLTITFDANSLPIPEEATERGLKLYRDTPKLNRELDSEETINAILYIAEHISNQQNIDFNKSAILEDKRLSRLRNSEWANVHAALPVLRSLLFQTAEKTATILDENNAFSIARNLSSLKILFPNFITSEDDLKQPKLKVLGEVFSESEFRDNLGSGEGGQLAAILTKAASVDRVSTIMSSSRQALKTSEVKGRKINSKKGRVSRRYDSTRNADNQRVGDLGEAFTNLWLKRKLGDGYSPECWVSGARYRNGLPDSGDDGLGYDFRVFDDTGELFGRPNSYYFIEVKSTSGDGNQPFPMSIGEWETASSYHQNGNDNEIYMILRVFHADSSPIIGDVILDPVATEQRNELRIENRDLWVTVAPRKNTPHIQNV